MYQRKLLFILIFVLTGLMISCSDSSTGPEPEPPVTTGTLEVSASTTGEGTDEDGYTITLDNTTSKSLSINGSITFSDLEKGVYTLYLTGLADGCTVNGDNPVSLNVISDEVTTEEFEVICEQSSEPETGSKVVFFSDRDGDEEIFLMNADGSNTQKITDNKTSDWHPSISNDGKKIAFVRGGRDLFIMDVDGSNEQQLTSSSGILAYPSWSPDDSKIIFGDDRSGYHEIYTIKLDGSGLVQLTNSNDFNDSNFNNYSPRMSPDGSKIAFQRGNSKTSAISHIFTMNADGTDLQKITSTNNDDNISNHAPSWSPDGSKLAFQSDQDGDNEIYTMNPDGSGIRKLTDNSEYDSSPVWSPDGKELLFDSERDGDTEIYKINADGSGKAVNLTNAPSSDEERPDWN